MNKIIEGQISFGGMFDALKAVSLLKYVKNGVMRIQSNEGTGMIGVFCGRYITGAFVTLTGEIGYDALRKLLSARDGTFAFLDAGSDVVTDLRQSLGIDINLLIDSKEVREGTPLSDDSLTGMVASQEDLRLYDTAAGGVPPPVPKVPDGDRVNQINNVYERISYQADAGIGARTFNRLRSVSSEAQQRPAADVRSASLAAGGGVLPSAAYLQQSAAGGQAHGENAQPPPLPLANPERQPPPLPVQDTGTASSQPPPLPAQDAAASRTQPPPLPALDAGAGHHSGRLDGLARRVEPPLINRSHSQVPARPESAAATPSQGPLASAGRTHVDANGFEVVDYSQLRRQQPTMPEPQPLPDISSLYSPVSGTTGPPPYVPTVPETDKVKAKPPIPEWDIPYEPPRPEEEPLPSQSEFKRLKRWHHSSDLRRHVGSALAVCLIAAGAWFAWPYLAPLLKPQAPAATPDAPKPAKTAQPAQERPLSKSHNLRRRHHRS